MTKAQLRLTIAAVIVLVAAFLAFRLLSMWGDLGDAPALERPGLIAPGLALYAATLLTFALLWRSVMRRLDPARPSALDSIAVFCASWLGRYVPSSLPYFAGKFAMGMRLGHGKPALAASMLYENVIIVSVGAFGSAVVIPLVLAGRGGPPLFLGAGVAGVAGLLLLSPPFFHRLVSLATRVTGRAPVARESLLSYRGIVVASALAAVSMVLNGAGFALILSAFVDLSATELVASAAIFNLAGAVGVMVLPLPSGLGVREAVLIGLLQFYVPVEIAAAAAVVIRLGGLGVDLLFGVAGAGLFALRQRHPDVSETPLPQRQLDAAA